MSNEAKTSEQAAAWVLTDADIEKVAAAWASMDGKKDRFWACKADGSLEDTEGRYGGYMADARELLCRSGLFTYTATFIVRTPTPATSGEKETE